MNLRHVKGLEDDTQERISGKDANNELEKLQAETDDAVNQFEFIGRLTEEEVQEETQTGNNPRGCFEPHLPAVKESRGEEEGEGV